jgi:hypothetical protein
MGSGLSCAQHLAGSNAQNQRGDDGKQQSRANRNANPGHGNLSFGFRFLRGLRRNQG